MFTLLFVLAYKHQLVLSFSFTLPAPCKFGTQFAAFLFLFVPIGTWFYISSLSHITFLFLISGLAFSLVSLSNKHFAISDSRFIVR
jgi:uncharacterized phage infection (PIP) family protein YhgE